jgi:magnesium transporter
MEDLVDTNPRPKMEDYDDYIFMVLKMLYYGKEKKDVVIEHVGIVLGKSYVISFQEEAGEDVFDRIRDRLRNNKGKIRKLGTDYLAYSLVDSIVDNYFLILEGFGEKIEFLDEELVKNPKPEILRTIHEMKRNMIYLRKSVWPLREVVGSIQRTGSSLISDNTRIYLRDVYDHTIQVIDTMETFRDILSGMVDIYLSSVSYRLNEIMKVLTVISTIFIPLTFITSMYGMNFRHMPEIGWYWGYPTVLFVMIAIAIGMLVYFMKRRWI